MTAAVPVPLVSGLFSAITQGETLTVMNLVSLIVAIPTTLIAKAVEGVAPFAQGATAGQAKFTTHRRDFMYAYGSVQIVDGFVSAGLDFQYKKLFTKLHESKKRVPQIHETGGDGRWTDNRLQSDESANWTFDDSSWITNLLSVTNLLLEIAEQILSMPGMYEEEFTSATTAEQCVWSYQWCFVLVDSIALVGEVSQWAKGRTITPDLDPGKLRAAPIRFVNPPSGLIANCVFEAIHFVGMCWLFAIDTGSPDSIRAAYFIDPLKGIFETLLFFNRPSVATGVAISDVVLQGVYGGLWLGGTAHLSSAAGLP